MIQKFKNFDPSEFIRKKNALKESLVNESAGETAEELEKSIFGGIPDRTMEMPKEDPNIKDEDVITGTPVYSDKYLVKIAQIISKRFEKMDIGKFVMHYNVIYLDGVPGVCFVGTEGNEFTIVCCRNTNVKTISIFKDFKIGETNKAIVSYSTERVGFADMLDQLEDDLKTNSEINEGAGNSVRFGDGYSPTNLANLRKMPWGDKAFLYDLVSTNGKAQAKNIIISKFATDARFKSILRSWGTVTQGSAGYLIGCIYDIMNDRTFKDGTKYADANSDFKALRAEYLAKYNGSSPAIETAYGVDFEVDDEEADKRAQQAAEEARKAEEERIRLDTEKYLRTIKNLEYTTAAMCNYVKQNGNLDADDKSAMSRRGVLLTGKGGIGKTRTVKTILKEKNMIKNRDYVWVGSESVTADKLYTLMYKYNGKLLIFDDTGDIFEGKYNGPLWKTALQTDLDDCEIGYPGANSKLKFYDDRILTDRQKRYYAEIGHKSDEDKSIFYKQQMRKRGLRYSKLGKGVVSDDPTLSQADIEFLMGKIDELWKEETQNVQPSMPMHFYYTGVVIIMSNMDRDEFIADMSEKSWKALASRFKNFDINPLAESLWSRIKAMILREYNDETIPDDFCAIPRKMTEDFIRVVEEQIADGKADGLTYRTITAYSVILRGAPGLETWEDDLRYELENG